MIKEYLAYLNNNPHGYWFKKKAFGWGWVPVKWQGWFVILVFIAFLIWNASQLGGLETEPMPDLLVGYVLRLIFSILILLSICYLKGEKPSWSFGLPKSAK